MERRLDLESQVTSEISVVVVGDQRSGKTSLVRNHCHGTFVDEYVGTVGVDYDCRILDVDGKYVKVHLWDASGQEGFLWASKRHIRSADAFVYVYDVTDERSFASVSRWMNLINRVATSADLPKLLIGTKLDQRKAQVVSSSRAKEFAIPEGFEHIEVSSVTGKNVNAAFYILSVRVLQYRRLGCHGRLGVASPVITFPDVHIHEDPSSGGGALDDGHEYNHLFKILLVGDQRVGKTALRHRFCKDRFSPDYIATTSFDYGTRVVQIDGERIKLQVWDISGDAIYDQMRKGYYRGANAYVILYDVTNKKTFEKAESLLKELSLYGQSECPKIVVGNKTDVGHKKGVDHSEAVEWADGWGVPIMETSCKRAANVDAVFMKLALALRKQLAPWKRLYVQH